MADDLNPAALRALADRLEAEAATAQEEKDAARLQALLDSGQEALAEKVAERLFDRLGAHLEQAFDARGPEEDEDGDGEGKEGEGEEDAAEEAGEEGETDEHGDILPGRWRPVKVFGAKIYSGAAEPDTVRYRNELGQMQSRPGRVPGKPYQAEWEAVPDDEPAEDEGVEDAA